MTLLPGESQLPMEIDREAKSCPCGVHAHEFIGKPASLMARSLFQLESAAQGQVGRRSIFESVKVGVLLQGYDLEKRGAQELRKSARERLQ